MSQSVETGKGGWRFGGPVIACVTVALIGLRLAVGAASGSWVHVSIGLAAWCALVIAVARESNAIRHQVALAIFCLTVVRSFAPTIFNGVSTVAPLTVFDPPQYGLVYLSLVSLWRVAPLTRIRWGVAAPPLMFVAFWSLLAVNRAGGGAGGALVVAFLVVESPFVFGCIEGIVSWVGQWCAAVVNRLSGYWRHFRQRMPRDLFVAGLTFLAVALCLYLDSDATLERQLALGICAWTVLVVLLLGETPAVRVQVAIAVVFATIGEHFASPFMGGYIYRFENVPAYVPPGHGMVYLTAVALARSDYFRRWQRPITLFVLAVGGAWSLWGVTFAERGDAVGALLFCVFAVFVFLGRSPLVYLAAFFITTWLELIGTHYATWRWVVIDPVLGLPQGNPPSGVAAWYCLVDAVALGGAPVLLRAFERWRRWVVVDALKRPVWESGAAEG